MVTQIPTKLGAKCQFCCDWKNTASILQRDTIDNDKLFEYGDKQMNKGLREK